MFVACVLFHCPPVTDPRWARTRAVEMGVEVAHVLVHTRDDYSFPDFDALKVESLVRLMVASPSTVAE